MPILDLNIDIKDIEPRCDTLRTHWYKLANMNAKNPGQERLLESEVINFEDIAFGKIHETIPWQEDLNIYDNVLTKLFRKYKIPSSKKEVLKASLEKCATLYVKTCTDKFTAQIVQNEVNRIKAIAKQADQLATALGTLIDEHGCFSTMFKIAPLSVDNLDIQKIAKDGQANLAPLINLPDAVKQTQFGQSLMIGRSGRKKTWSLHNWVTFMWEIWVVSLGRIPNSSQDKTNGRQKFLNFLCDCMEPLHPDLGQDKIINVYNRIQKEV